MVIGNDLNQIHAELSYRSHSKLSLDPHSVGFWPLTFTPTFDRRQVYVLHLVTKRSIVDLSSPGHTWRPVFSSHAGRLGLGSVS